MITKRNAFSIARKLEAEIKNGSRHDIVIVRHGGQLVAQYGISRGSQDKNHNHIPRQLKVSNTQAIALVQCSLSKDGYFSILRDKGLLGHYSG
jgi:hypothetical protein